MLYSYGEVVFLCRYLESKTTNNSAEPHHYRFQFLSVILASAVLAIGAPSAFAQQENTSNKQVSPQPASTHLFPFTNVLTTEEYHFDARNSGRFTLYVTQSSTRNTEVTYSLWQILHPTNHEVHEVTRTGNRNSMGHTFRIPKAGEYYFEIKNRSKDNNNQYIPVSGKIRFTPP